MRSSSTCPRYLFLALAAFHLTVAAQHPVLEGNQGPKQGAENSAHPASSTPSARLQNPLIAKVGPLELRLVDLIREVNQLIPLNFYHKQIPQDRMAEFRKKAFDSLVFKRRIYLDALDRKMPIEEKAVRARLRKAIKNAGPEYQNLSEEQFAVELEKNRPQILRLLLTEKNKERFDKTIPGVTEESLRKVYQSRIKEDPKAFLAPREARLLHIFVKMDPARQEKEISRKKAYMAEAKKELDKGVPFSQVARLYSEGDKARQGGDLGWVKEGNMRSKTLDTAAFKMKAGEVSGIIESLYGLHILKCVEVKPLRTLGFDEVKGLLKIWLTKEHAKVATQRWKKELAKKYPLELLAPDLIIPPKLHQKEKKAATPDSSKASSRPASRPSSGEPIQRAGTQPSKD